MPPKRGLKASGGNVPAPEPDSETPAAPGKSEASVATAAKLQQLYESGKENAVRARSQPRGVAMRRSPVPAARCKQSRLVLTATGAPARALR